MPADDGRAAADEALPYHKGAGGRRVSTRLGKENDSAWPLAPLLQASDAGAGWMSVPTLPRTTTTSGKGARRKERKKKHSHTHTHPQERGECHCSAEILPMRRLSSLLRAAAGGNVVSTHIDKLRAAALTASTHASNALFPNERPGVSYDLNWSLAEDRVSPAFDAFRNASTATLLQYAFGQRADAGGVVLDESSSATAVETFVVAGTFGSAPKEALLKYKQISADQFNKLMRDITAHLSYVPQVFVHDGSFGSHRSAEVQMRVISDNSVSALQVAHLLNRAVLGAPESFVRPARLYVAPGFQPTQDPAKEYGLPADLGNKAFVVLNGKSGAVAVGGAFSGKALHHAALHIGSWLSSDGPTKAAVLPGFLSSDNSTLVVDPSASSAVLLPAGGKGLSFSWRGVVDAPEASAAVVEKGAGLSIGPLPGVASRPNLVDVPKTVLFVVPSLAIDGAELVGAADADILSGLALAASSTALVNAVGSAASAGQSLAAAAPKVYVAAKAASSAAGLAAGKAASPETEKAVAGFRDLFLAVKPKPAAA